MVAIIGILSAVAIPAYQSYKHNAAVASMFSLLKLIKKSTMLCTALKGNDSLGSCFSEEGRKIRSNPRLESISNGYTGYSGPYGRGSPITFKDKVSSYIGCIVAQTNISNGRETGTISIKISRKEDIRPDITFANAWSCTLR